MMDKLILWMLIAYGMSTIIVYGHIFDKPRDWVISKSTFWGSFMTCMLCISAWCGFFLSFALGGLTDAYFDTGNFTFFFDGMFTAGSVWAINAFVEFFEESRIK
jgi:hypothetical protein